MQNTIIALLEFLYNNLVTVAIIFIGFLLLYTSTRLILLEYRLNHNLNLKKILFGDRRAFRAKSFNIRRVMTFLLGAILLFLIIYQAYGEPIRYQRNTKQITSPTDAIEIYQNFNSKFYSDPFAKDLIIPNDKVSFQSYQAKTFTGFEYVVESPDNIFILNQQGIQILSKRDRNVSFLKAIPFATPQCSLESLQPKGLAIYNNYLIVLTTESLGQCKTNPEVYALRDNRTHVSVYDLSTFEKLEEYIVSGHLNDAYIDNEKVILVNSTWIPFADESINLEDFLPFYIKEDSTIKHPLDEILYIEKTNPNSFVTVTRIDFLTYNINQESILTDYQSQIDIIKDAVLLAIDIYNFNQASDLFELSNPVRSIDAAIVRFNLLNKDVYYFRTQVLEGSLATNDALFVTDDGVKVFTKRSSGSNRVHILANTLRYDNEKSLANSFLIESIVFENNYFYIEYKKDFARHYIYLNQSDSLDLVATRNEPTFFDGYHKINDTKYVTFQQFDNDKINIQLLEYFAGSLLYETRIEIEYRLSRKDSNLSNEDLKNIIVINGSDNLFVPSYLFSNFDLSTINENSVHLYDEDSNLSQSMRLGALGQFKTPFAYRIIRYGQKLIHITPGGYQITDINDIETIERTIYFANQ